MDQKTLAHLVSFDTSTIGAVIDRLEAKALLTRSLSPEDRRVRLLNLTPAGQAMLEQAMPAVQRTQERILEPLTAQEKNASASCCSSCAIAIVWATRVSTWSFIASACNGLAAGGAWLLLVAVHACGRWSECIHFLNISI